MKRAEPKPDARGRTIKRRLSPQESKALALAAARELLVQGGPQAITLKAVAGKIGQTHSNLLHHFGSIGALHRDLTLYLTKSLYENLVDAFGKRQQGTGTVRDSVDTIFDAFDAGGGARLGAWLALGGNNEFFKRFSAVFGAIPDAGAPGQKSSPERRVVAFQMALLAVADGLMGEEISLALRIPRHTAREVAVEMFSALLAKEYGWNQETAKSGALQC